MTLNEKFKKWWGEPCNPTIEEDINDLENIAEEFAIDFTEWVVNSDYILTRVTTKELLEIYKKEKGL